jgi:DNA gyrase/topoisomerase IV subunit B
MQVTFVPDASVFSPGINFDADTIISRLRELAFLNAGATMKLRLLKNGQVLPTSGAKQAAAAADKPKRRSKQATAQQEEAGTAADAAAGNGADVSGNGAAAAAAVAEEQGWQVFCYQEGLKEYVQWSVTARLC